MNLISHKIALTTPVIREELRTFTSPQKVLAKKYNLSRSTARKWQSREDYFDRSHGPHKLQTTLSTAQEAVVGPLRQFLLLPLDD